MLTTNIRGGKVFVAKQKNCGLKKRIFKVKSPRRKLKKRTKSKEIVRTPTNNMNNLKNMLKNLKV